MSPLRWRSGLAVVAALGLLGARGHFMHTAVACPFCNATQQTLAQEIEAADAVALVALVKAAAPTGDDSAGPGDPATGLSTFKVLEVLKGAGHLAGKKTIEALHFGDAKPGELFVVMGQALPNLQWSTPIPLTRESADYVRNLQSLPSKGGDRLAFFQDFLRSDDSLLSQDAYDEFARAPYGDLRELKPRMHHDELVKWIADETVSPSHRRLYLTMLSVCGQPGDLPLLEELMQATERRKKAGLDAMIACYLTLKGPSGMPLIEDLFLKNKEAEYADTYAAVMALRFHGQESDVIPKTRLIEALRHMLDRPELADLVIADLARWQDWGSMDRMIGLFKNADDKSSWVRVPVINYLQAAANQSEEHKQGALAAIDQLEKIDPAAVKQAKAYAAFGVLAQPKPKEKELAEQFSQDAQSSEDDGGSRPDSEQEPAPALSDKESQPAPKPSAGAAAPPQPPRSESSAGISTQSAAPIAAAPKTVEEGEPTAAQPRSTLRIVVLLAIGGLVLVGLRIAARATARPTA
jgi:cobalamin biosynthesis Mg chelatase CobN